MLLRKFILILSLVNFSNDFAQEIVSSFALKLESKDCEVYKIIDTKKANENYFFINDNNTIKALKVTNKIQFSNSFYYNITENDDFKNILGHNKTSENPRLFWTTSNKNKIISQVYDFNSIKVISKTYILDNKNEDFLQSFSSDNYFYILNVVKNTNALKLYVFDNEGKLEEKIFDLSKFYFLSSKEEKETILYNLLKEDFINSQKPFYLEKMTNDQNNNIPETSRKRKSYFINDNKIIITLDNNIEYTHLISLNLKDFTAESKMISNPAVPYTKRSDVNSNSYLIDNLIFQIKSSASKLYMTVKSLDDVELANFSADVINPIKFNNTLFFKLQFDSKNVEILNHTEEFLEKMALLNIGISVRKMTDKYYFTFGSVTPQMENDAMIAYGGGAIGGIIAASTTIAMRELTGSFRNLNPYSKRNAYFTSGILNSNFTHNEDALPTFAIDKIRDFYEKSPNLNTATVFKKDNLCYFGFYDTKTNTYNFATYKDGE
jgi:hypothetical protein